MIFSACQGDLVFLEECIVHLSRSVRELSLLSSCYKLDLSSYFCSPIDPMHKWLSIKNSFVSIKISPTNLVFELIIQKNFYSQMRLVGLI